MGWKKSFHFRAVEREIQRRATIGHRRMGQELVQGLASDISTPAPPHSAPGQPAHMVTGEMIASLFWRIDVVPSAVRTWVGSTSDHAIYTEFGQAGGARYDPRPWFRPGLIKRIQTTIITVWSQTF